MVDILATARRSRGNRRKDRRSLRERLSQFWRTADAEPNADEGDDGEVVAAPRLLLARVFAFLGMALCVGLLGSLVMSLDNYSLRTKQFQVREFEVIGNHRLDPESIIAAAGATVGNDLFKIDLQAVRARLEKLPWVRHAKAQKQLPGRLVLEVEEYVPVVLVAGGKMMLADDSCHLIARPERGSHYRLPVVTGISIDDLQRGPPNAATLLARRRLRRLIDIVGAWPHSERFALGEVNWDPVRGITLLSGDDGAEIRVGHVTDDELSRRFRQIDALLADMERRGQRLRYALMDDEKHPGRAVVQTVAMQEAAAKAARRVRRAGGPASRRAPQGKDPSVRRRSEQKSNRKGADTAAGGSARQAGGR